MMTQIDPKIIENLAQMLNNIGNLPPRSVTSQQKSHQFQPHLQQQHTTTHVIESEFSGNENTSQLFNEHHDHRENHKRQKDRHNEKDHHNHNDLKFMDDPPVQRKRKPLRKPSSLNIVSDL